VKDYAQLISIFAQVSVDDGIQPKTSMSDLAKLKPAMRTTFLSSRSTQP
jgi:hypothetical protein